MRASIAIAVLAACGADHQNHPLERCATGQALVALRAGDGAWQMPQPTNGKYVMPVTGDYELVVVDKIGTAFYAQEELGTADEVQPFSPGCDADPTTFPITGTLAGDGSVWLDGNSVTISSSPRDFNLDAHRGAHELVVTTPSPTASPTARVAVQPLTITGPQNLGMLDPQAGMPLVQVALDIQNATGTVNTQVELETATGDFMIVSSGGTSTAYAIPSALLASGDQQWLDVSAGQESVYAKLGSQTTFTLPPPLTGITFPAGTTNVEWTTLPSSYSGVYMFLAGTSLQYISATRGWIEHHGAVGLTFSTDVPGYDPSWVVTKPMTDFGVWRDDGDVTYYSTVSAPPAARRSPRPDAPWHRNVRASDNL